MPPASKRAKKEEKEELIGAVLKDQIYRKAGLKKSPCKELEGSLFDHLCSLKEYQTRKYICDYASKICEENSEAEEVTINDEWLDSFVTRFCLVKKAQSKRCEGEELHKDISSDNNLSDNDQASPKHKSNNSMDIFSNTEDEKEEDQDSSSTENKHSDTSVSTVLPNEINNLSIGSECTIPICDSEGEQNNDCEPESDQELEKTVSIDTDKETKMDSSQNLDETKLDHEKSQSTDEAEVPTKGQSTDDNQSSDSDSTDSPSLLKSTNNDGNKSQSKPQSTNNENAESQSTNNSSKSPAKDLPSNNEEESSLKSLSSDSDEISTIKPRSHKSPNKSRCNKISESDSSNKDKSTKKSDTDCGSTEISESDDEGKSTEVSDSDNKESSNKPLIKLKSLASLMPEKEVVMLSSTEDEKDISGHQSGDDASSSDISLMELEESLPLAKMLECSKAEKAFYRKNRAELELKISEKITHCTACFQNVNRTLSTDVVVHPVLGVLVCKKCSFFYDGGDFQKDADGFDEYCRWCANGGDLLICDHCTNGFCKVCIKRNVGRSALKEAMGSEKWKCYVCDLTPLFELRSTLRIILDNLKQANAKSDGLTRTKRKEVSSVNKFANFKLQRELYKKKLSKNTHQKVHGDLCSSMEDMKELLSLCFKQLEKIDSKFQNNIDDQSYMDARRRFARLNKAMQSNFQKLLNSYLEGSNLTEEDVLGEKGSLNVNKATINDKVSFAEKGNDLSDAKKTQHEDKVTPKDESVLKSKKGKSPIAKKSTAKRKHSLSPKCSETPSPSSSMKRRGRGRGRGRCKRAKVQSDGESDSEDEHNNIDRSTKKAKDSVRESLKKEKKKEPDTDSSTKETKDEDVDSLKKDNSADESMAENMDKFDALSNRTDDSDGKSQSILKNVKHSASDREDASERKSKPAIHAEDTEKSNELAKRQLFNSDSSDNDEVNISSTVESILEEDSLKLDKDQKTSRKRQRSLTMKPTARKRTKLSLDKEAILEKKNAKAKNLLFNSSSDESFPSHPPKKIARNKSTSDDETDTKSQQEIDRVKKCFVSVCRLSPSIVAKIEANGFVLHQKVKRQKVKRLLKSNSSDSTSDTEYKKIMGNRMRKKKRGKAELSSGSDASDEDSNSENPSESNIKKVSKIKKHTKSKPDTLANMSLDDTDSDGSASDENSEEEPDVPVLTKSEGLNATLKKALLLTSEDDSSDSDGDSPGEEDSPKKSKKKKKEQLEEKSGKAGNSSEKKAFRSLFRSALMMTSESDSSSSESSEQSHSSDNPLDSGSDFENVKVKKKTSRRRDFSDDTRSSSSDGNTKKKSKTRKRIKTGSDSSSDVSDSKDKDSPKKETPNKKKVRKIIKDDDLLESTKNATQEEESRKVRVKERQERFQKLLDDKSLADEEFDKNVVLDFNSEKKIKTVYVDERLRKHLKPHQEKGIKFMWDATIEAVDMLDMDEGGGGCILAHCMGLGKTLQVIAFLHTLLTNRKTNTQISNVLVCCPVNTIYNWVAEFKNWLKGRLPFDVLELVSQKTIAHRAYKLDDWYKEGGVMVLGYDMFRNLTTANKKRSSRVTDILQKCLVSPGPDIIVCDEGHILKNEKTALAIALSKIQTPRRIVLTGTPLQNNLKEYHCMIQFVKPNLLGSRKEFLNRFVNPIEAGQCADADASDVRRMKRRAHILHNMLEGCVQRFDYSVIQPFLPPKYEYVISVQMTELQCQFYRHYLENLAQGGPKRTGSGLFVDFSNLSKIWNHPFVLQLDLRRNDEKEEDEEDDMGSFIDDGSTSSSEGVKSVDPPKENEPAEVIDPQNGLTDDGRVKKTWWLNVLSTDQESSEVLSDPTIGGKLILLVNILKKCDAAGDKVLLFSQSLLTLSMIEHFLGLIDAGAIPYGDESKPKFASWKSDRDYFRLDGSTALDIRKQQVKAFNNEKVDRCRLFLISTRAGGIGINLIGANRVIIFDSSWNPSHDIQSIFRIYRFGQKKKCYVYRFVAQGTMEEKIYSRQVTKLATSLRVVDEQQIKRNFRMDELVELYKFTPADSNIRDTPKLPEDLLLADLLVSHKHVIVNYHEHDSLLENQAEEELTEEERKAAWEDFEYEKRMNIQQRNVMNVATGNVVNIQDAVLEFDVESFTRNLESSHPTLGESFKRDAVRMAAERHQKAEIQNFISLNKVIFNLKSNMTSGKYPANSADLLNNLQIKLRLLEANIKRDSKIMENYRSHTLIRTPNQLPGGSGVQKGSHVGQQRNFNVRNIPNMQPVAKKSSSNISTASNSKNKDDENDIVTLE